MWLLVASLLKCANEVKNVNKIVLFCERVGVKFEFDGT